MGIILKKKVTKTLSNRPVVAEYTHENVKMARIRWDFSDTSDGLFYDKKLLLAYYKKDGALGEEFLIKRKEIDFNNPSEVEESIAERVGSRDKIVGEIKAVCSGALAQSLDISLFEVVELITPFWDEYEKDRGHFIKLGLKDWVAKLLVLNVNDPNHEYNWLLSPVDTNGTTCQLYMIYRMGY
jgi:hypothetical protein